MNGAGARARAPPYGCHRHTLRQAYSSRAMTYVTADIEAGGPTPPAEPRLRIPRPLAANDAELIAMAVSQNPELAGLAKQVDGRTDAVELARLVYLPDVIPSASIKGSVSQSLGAMLMLPTKRPAIRAEGLVPGYSGAQRFSALRDRRRHSHVPMRRGLI
jgi:hypothetical protein